MLDIKRPVRILILYAKVGGGHESIAYGLKDRLEEYYGADIEIVLADAISSIVDVTYQASTLLTPKVYNLFYKVSQSQFTINIWRELNALFNEDKLKKIISDANPDIIIDTYFLLSKEIKNVIKKQKKQIPLVVYIADPFSMHPAWFRKETDLYLSYDLDHLLHARGSHSAHHKTIPIGMPIRKIFYKKNDKKKTLHALGFENDKFTILFGGSGLGMDNLERIARPFTNLELPTQAIFICGRNGVLKKALNIIVGKQKNIKVLGVVTAEKMAQLMQASDLFVGKLGPNIMFEAILSNLPTIATPPILPQERGNRHFTEQENVGFLSTSTSQTMKLIKQIVSDPAILEEKKKQIRKNREDLLRKEKEGMPQFFDWVEKVVSGRDTTPQEVKFV